MDENDDTVRVLKGLEWQFPDEKAEDLLEIELGHKVLSPLSYLAKSFYDFDLETPDGIDKLLTLLPVLDPVIIEQVANELWPGYPPENFDPKRFRLEIRGYLLDYLEDQESYSNGEPEEEDDNSVSE